MDETPPPAEEKDQSPLDRVAVVIPALNAEATIGRQIAAVLADRNERTELILVDNGSTDGTLEVMRNATAGHELVRIVSEPRRGVNRARNAGIAASDAPLVLLCDADDEIEPGWIGALATALRSADLAGGMVRRVTHDGEVVSDVERPNSQDPFGWGVAYPFGGTCGFHRTAWERSGGFDPRMSGGGDEGDFFIRAQIVGASLAWATEGVVRYTLRANAEDHIQRRLDEGWKNLSRAYWYGRLRGWPRYGTLCIDLLKSALLVPVAPFSAHWRSVIHRRMARRWGRLIGAFLYLPPEVRRRIGANRQPTRHHQK